MLLYGLLKGRHAHFLGCSLRPSLTCQNRFTVVVLATYAEHSQKVNEIIMDQS